MKTIHSLPKGEVRKISGLAMVLKGNDIDTDRIIPARFLKCVSFKDLANQVFEDDRNELKGSHPFDLDIYKEASILVVNGNFGCGSSREHAPQALMRWGIRALIGESFAEIFHGNCLALGIPCVTTSKNKIQELQGLIGRSPKNKWVLNIESELLICDSKSWTISLQPGPKEMLISGRWDGTSQLIEREEDIQRVIKNLPYLNNFKI